jgi:hypothetical protein
MSGDAPGVINVRLAAELHCCVDLRGADRMTYLLRNHFFLLAFTFASLAGPIALAEGADRRTPVAVMPLPELFSSEVTPQTKDLAASVARELESAGVRIVTPEPTERLSLEELTWMANSSFVALAVGVRSLGVSKPCSLVATPRAIPRPPEADGWNTEAELGRVVRALVAHERSAASARLAEALVSAGGWCRGPASDGEGYLLEGTDTPAVVVGVAPENGPAAASSFRTVFEAWLDAERERGRTTMR